MSERTMSPHSYMLFVMPERNWASMPALAKPRHEAFAQALFAALSNGQPYSQGKAYKSAGYIASNPNSADAAASRLLRKVKPILDRVRELVAEANARNQHKIDLSRDRVGKDLDAASRMAKEQGNGSGLVSSALGIAKVLHALPNDNESPFSFKDATSMQDLGRKLLRAVGVEDPTPSAIELAIKANDAFV